MNNEDKEAIKTLQIAEQVSLKMLYVGCVELKKVDASPVTGLFALAMCAATYGVFVDQQKVVSLEKFETDFIEAFRAALKDVNNSKMRTDLDEIQKRLNAGKH